MANSLNPLPELADSYRRKVKLVPFLTGSGKECSHARVALDSLAGLADNVGVDQVHVSACGRLARARNPRLCPRSVCSRARRPVVSVGDPLEPLSGSHGAPAPHCGCVWRLAVLAREPTHLAGFGPSA